MIQHFAFAYGKATIEMQIPEGNVLGVLAMDKVAAERPAQKILTEALANPVGMGLLEEDILAKKPQKILIVVSDITRSIPYYQILPLLTQRLETLHYGPETVTFLIANGTHRAMTEEEIKSYYGEETASRYSVLNHDCRNRLVSLGTMSTGNELWVDALVQEHDYLLLTGAVNTHYFAGFSGGRKSILPGIAGYETIQRNHSRIKDPHCGLARMDNNPINLEMEEAARLANPDFILNVLLDTQKHIVDAVCGDLDLAFIEARKRCIRLYQVPFSEQVDVIFTSVGGYPKDLNFYQSQKALNNTADLVKPGGMIVLITQCPNGIGNDSLQQELSSHAHLEEILQLPPEAISVGGHRAVATAKLLEKYKIVVVTDMPTEDLTALHFRKIDSLDAAVALAREEYGLGFSSYVVPNGTLFFPVKTS